MERNSVHQTRDQLRTRYAWQCVKYASDEMKKDFDRYESLVLRFPATVMNNRLGQALASLFAKPKDAECRMLLAHLHDWLTGAGPFMEAKAAWVYDPPYAGKVNIMEAIQSSDGRTYLRATEEALAILNYLRRFARGVVEMKRPQRTDDSTDAEAAETGVAATDGADGEEKEA